MKINPNYFRFSVAVIAMVAFSFLAASPLSAAGRKKNPASKIFVADVEGTAQIDTGETIDSLTKRSVYTAQGTVIETEDDSTNAMVFSNGTGIYFDPETRLEINKFVQEPFSPNRTDMEVEPSISTTRSFLPRGVVGICTSKLVAGSTMRYSTPHAAISIKGRRVVIESTNAGTRVSLIEGEVTVQAGKNDAGGQVLTPGQQAFIPAGGGPMQISNISNDQMANLDDKVTMACMARKTVYFEVRDNKVDDQLSPTSGEVTAFDETEEKEIVAVETTPGDIPVQFTVSAANLTNS